MTGQRVDLLYDALHACEARRRGAGGYPVHKTLSAARLGHDDVYDWIIERVGPGSVRHALDAGCGVGYGSIRLAQRLGCRVTGVSLSEREVASARAAAQRLGVAATTDFRCASFDAVPRAAYDLVVAVESLKHSGDLALSLRALLAALVPGGLLAVVDDCYGGDGPLAVERQIAADWELARLYTLRDFLEPLAGAPYHVVDLTRAVRRSGRLSIAARLLGVSMIRPFAGARAQRALRAFRGGLRLEQLYAAGAMSYQAIFVEAGGIA
jgi:SAM-dependent methyltransferase